MNAVTHPIDDEASLAEAVLEFMRRRNIRFYLFPPDPAPAAAREPAAGSVSRPDREGT